MLVVCLLLSCDNSLEPLNEESGIYSYYASLDMNEEVNYIRVRELRSPFTAEATEEIDAVVTLENLNTGEVTVLEHERQAYEDIFLHNFAVTNLEGGVEYELKLVRSDGSSMSSKMITPTMPEPVVEPENPDCFTPISITLDPINKGTYQRRFIFEAGTIIETFLLTFSNLSEELRPYTITFVPNDIISAYQRTCQQLNNAEITFYIKRYSPGFYEKISNDSLDILETTRLFGAYYEEEIVIPLNLSASKKRR